MLEFGDLFASPTAMEAYFVGSAVLVGLNGLFVAWIFLRRETLTSPQTRRQLKIAGALAIAVLFLLTGIGAGISSFNSHRKAAADSARPASISIDDIHRKIDMKKLPI